MPDQEPTSMESEIVSIKCFLFIAGCVVLLVPSLLLAMKAGSKDRLVELA